MHRPLYFNFNISKELTKFAFVFALFGFGNTIAGSIFPLYLQTFSSSIFLIGIIAAVAPIIAALLSVLIGNAVDRYGSKIFISYGLFITSILYIGFYFSPFLMLVAIIQILSSFSKELVYTPFYTLIRDSSRPRKLAQNFSFVSSLSTLGYITAPLLGGYLALYNFRIPFVISASVIMFSYLFLINLKPPKHIFRDTGIGISCFKNTWKDLMRLPREGKNLIFSLLTLNSWYGAKWFIGPLLLYSLGFKTQDIGIWLSISLLPFLLLSLPLGKLVDSKKTNKTKIILWGLMFSAIPLMFIGFSTGMWLYFFIVAIAIGNAISDSAIDARITELTEKDKYGEMTGLLESVKNIGGFIGPIATTFFAQYFGYTYSILPISVMFLAAVYFLTHDMKLKGILSL